MMNHLCLTNVIKSMCDLMSNNHSYSAKVKSLVLMFAEERWLQDSCWKHWTEKNKQIHINNRRENNIQKSSYLSHRLSMTSLILVSIKALTYLISVGRVKCVHHSSTNDPPEEWLKIWLKLIQQTLSRSKTLQLLISQNLIMYSV